MEVGRAIRRLLHVSRQTMSEAWTKMIVIKLFRKGKKEGRKEGLFLRDSIFLLVVSFTQPEIHPKVIRKRGCLCRCLSLTLRTMMSTSDMLRPSDSQP